MISTGLDRLLAAPQELSGRRYALLAHDAAVTAALEPAHLALSRCGQPPVLLLAPEHGFHGIEQDMVASTSGVEPWTGMPVLSLYGESETSLRPAAEVFAGLDLLVVDLQDVGSRYYTFAATAVWAAESAADAGCEVWVLDRPNPLGGVAVEGNLPHPGFESFVGAFALPVRHGLTLGELVRFEAGRRGFAGALRVWPLSGWSREMRWDDTQRPWIAPSPNMPTVGTAVVYPGSCLVEATELSEGRGTTRPFQLLGAPGLDPPALAAALGECGLPGVAFLPTYFRPQYQKHRGAVCGGVEVVVTDPSRFSPYRFGVSFLDVVHRLAPAAFRWRTAPYEFVDDRPAIDLLTGGEECRTGIESGAGLTSWIASWERDEESFRSARRSALLYPEEEQR